MHILQLEDVPIFQQLQIEEALLRADDRNWCIVNYGSPRAIVMGISGKFDELVCKNKITQDPIQVIRRFSGGGTVVIDENTCFITFICNTSFIPIKPFPVHVMQWTEQFYRPLFNTELFAIKENDYVLGDYKFGGNAQSICKNRWLHHSSILWDYSSENMEYLLLPKKIPNYRSERAHTEFLCKIKDYWPEKSQFRKDFLNQLQTKFKTRTVKKEEIEVILKAPHRKATVLM